MHASENIIGDELDREWDAIVERWKQMAAESPEVWENSVASLQKEMRKQYEVTT